jgi:hypothetical protein
MALSIAAVYSRRLSPPLGIRLQFTRHYSGPNSANATIRLIEKLLKRSN